MYKVIISFVILFVLAGDGLALLAEIANLRPQDFISYRENDTTSTLSFHAPLANLQLDLPLPKLLFYSFYSGGVFNEVAAFDLDYAIYALPNGAKEGSDWVDIGFLDQCFPYPLGETYLRLDLEWHMLLGEKVYQAAMDSLARKIREKYNREHPEHQVRKVAIYMMWWPRSEETYTAMRDEKNTHWYLLTAEQ